MTTAQTTETKDSYKSPLAYFTPSVDIFEGEEGFLVIADIPGVSSEGLDIQFENDTLVVVGHRSGDGTEAYRRAFKLSSRVDVDAIEASLNAGVLTINLPKSEQAKPRQIPIKAIK